MKTEILEKLLKISSEIRKEKGEIVLFGLLLRTDIFDKTNEEKWDLLFSATWARSIQKEHEYIFTKLVKEFKPIELSDFLQKVFVVPSGDATIKSLTKVLGKIEDQYVLRESLVAGNKSKEISIRKSYIFASTPKDGKIKKASIITEGTDEGSGIESGEKPKALGKVKAIKGGH